MPLPLIAVIPVALLAAAMGAITATAIILTDHKDGPQIRYDRQRKEQNGDPTDV